MNLFDQIDPPAIMSWKPPELIDIPADIKNIEVDYETNGLRWWEEDRPIGVGVGWEDRDGKYHSTYLPYRHRTGGNLDEQAVIRWQRENFRGRHITNLNTRFDVHMAYADGIDLEALGNTVSDVAHSAALLDDHRYKFSLEALVEEFLVGEAKVKVVNGIALDGSKMASYHPSMVSERAQADVRQVWKLRQHFKPLLEKEELMKVHDLEDRVIYVVTEMERNGARIDLERLERYIDAVRQEIGTIWKGIHDEIGVKVEPGSPNSMTALFNALKLPITRTSSGRPSFTDMILKAHEAHPIIAEVRRMVLLMGLESRYLHKYPKAIDSHGVLRYALHQLRSVKSDADGAEATGTISGRFSSTAIVEGFGVNIQQVMKTAKQRVKFGYDEDDDSHDDELYIIRDLHVPETGEFLSADAMQIEYRIFAAHMNDPAINEAYAKDPYLKFHHMMHGKLKVYKPKLTYRRAKDTSFGKIYGAGIKKIALMLEFITQAQFDELTRTKAPYDHPLLEEAREVMDIYDTAVPFAKRVLENAKNLAEKRGYVKTILGRRTRFINGQRSHKGLNAVIQGTAADIMKQKLVELHDERSYTGLKLRYTVHDEVDGDIPDAEHAKRVGEVLNRQSFPELSIPILWEVGTGKTWKDCA